jgi:hypothetical protein
MSRGKKVWTKPVLQELGDVQTLTRQQGPPCSPSVKKGHGTGDTFSNNTPNVNTGCFDGASGF